MVIIPSKMVISPYFTIINGDFATTNGDFTSRNGDLLEEFDFQASNLDKNRTKEKWKFNQHVQPKMGMN